MRTNLAGPLIGRDAELARLRACVEELAAGRGQALLLDGEPGIGKSALLGDLAARAARTRCQVLAGAGDELSQAFPLLPLLDALAVRASASDPRRQKVLRLLNGDDGPRTSGVDPVIAASEQILALVNELCAVAPTLLIVDDLQWADPATVALWSRLVREVDQLPLLLAGAMRPIPRRADLAALRRALARDAVLRLGPLSESAVVELATTVTGAPPGQVLRELAAGAAGNPLYVVALLDALSRSETLVVADGVAEVTQGHALPTLASAIADRLGFLTEGAITVLRAAALLGVEFSVADLATVLGRQASDLLPALAEAQGAGVLVDRERVMAFRHPLIRSALYDGMPAPARAAWHAEAARALADAGAPVEHVARQLRPAVGIEPGRIDAWMLNWLAGATQALVNQVPQVAVELLSPALEHRHDPWLAAQLAAALLRLGRLADAEQQAVRALADVTDPDLLVDLHDTLASCRLDAGRSGDDATIADLEQAVRGPGLDVRHRARLTATLARALIPRGELDEVVRTAQAALALGTEADDGAAQGWALNALAFAHGVRGECVESLAAADRGLAVAAGPALTDLALLLQCNRAATLTDLDRVGAARDALRSARRLAVRAGNVRRLGQVQHNLAELLFLTGSWDDALAETDNRFEATTTESAYIAYTVGAAIAFHRDDGRSARRHLGAAAAAQTGLLASPPSGLWPLARSLDREHASDPAGALAVFRAEFSSDAAEPADVMTWLADATRLAMTDGDAAFAAELTARAEALLALADVPVRRALAAHCRGLADRDHKLLLAAAEGYAESGRQLPRAQALEAAAELLAETGDTASARALFNQAGDLYTALGAEWDNAKLRARFRSYGMRRGSRAARRRAKTGWEALTASELKVAGLVAEGLSNPQIAERLVLSRGTVAVHVSHILAKLGVRSRVEIARHVAQRPVP